MVRAMFVAILLLACAGPVLAQTEWLVTEVRAGDTSSDASQTTLRIAEILRSRGVPVIDGKSAASEIEHKHSRTPVRLQPDELERLDQALRTLAAHLASENLTEARAALEEVERLTPDARDYLNRQVNRARRRFHTCLLAAHLFAKEGYDDDAFQQVRKCARDFPGFEPEEGEYMPDSIKEFFGRAREELQSIRPATLKVRLEDGSKESCQARINGIDQGPLPAQIVEIRADAVRVQLECSGRSGRIHNVPVRPGDNELVIDPRLDHALDTTSTLLLHYPSAAVAAELREKHGLHVARVIGAGQLLEVFGGRLTRLDVATQTKIEEADLAAASLEDAVDAVLRARSEQAPAAAPPLALRPSEPSSSSVLEPLAWISLGAAVVAGGVSVVAWQVREDAARDTRRASCLDELDPDRPTRRQTCPEPYDRMETAEDVILASVIPAGVFAGLAALFFILDSQAGAEGRATAQRAPCLSGPGDVGIACRLSF